MSEPTNHLTQLSNTAKARLYAYHGGALLFGEHMGAANAWRAAQARIDEIRAIPADGYLALDVDEFRIIQEGYACV